MSDSSIDGITEPSFLTALVAGGCAGTSVDVALFPIDTLKTRLQSPQGFLKAGGFRGIYNGLGAAAAGSAPGAALFFSTYEVSWERAFRCIAGAGDTHTFVSLQTSPSRHNPWIF